jgi:hypothetical protein
MKKQQFGSSLDDHMFSEHSPSLTDVQANPNHQNMLANLFGDVGGPDQGAGTMGSTGESMGGSGSGAFEEEQLKRWAAEENARQDLFNSVSLTPRDRQQMYNAAGVAGQAPKIHTAAEQAFEKHKKPMVAQLPKGWRRVASRSRPGDYSYLQEHTKKRYKELPAWAWVEQVGGTGNMMDVKAESMGALGLGNSAGLGDDSLWGLPAGGEDTILEANTASGIGWGDSNLDMMSGSGSGLIGSDSLGALEGILGESMGEKQTGRAAPDGADLLGGGADVARGGQNRVKLEPGARQQTGGVMSASWG